MVAEWRASTWGEEISLEYGKALRARDRGKGMYRVFGSNGPIGWSTKSLADGPGVILGRKGAYRGVEFSREPFFVIDTAYYVVPKTELDMRWLYYAIKYHKLGEVDDGSPIPSTTRAAVYMLELDVPPLIRQRAIAHTLGTLDDKIELNRRMNETLEAMAKALFKAWFVDFDPVRAKMEGCWRPGQSIPGFPAHLYDLFPDRLVSSELGKIPEGWSVSSVAKIATVLDCLHSRKPVRRKGGGLLIQVFNVGVSGRLDFSDPYYISQDDYAVWTRRMVVLPGDLVITKTGRVGAVGQMPSGYKAALGRNMVGVRAIPGVCSPSFLKECLLSDLMRRQMGRYTSHGTILSSLHVNTIAELRVVQPRYEVVLAYDALAKPIHDRLDASSAEDTSLTALREVALPTLFSRESIVKDKERSVRMPP